MNLYEWENEAENEKEIVCSWNVLDLKGNQCEK
jgi:hypothetical protein